MSLESTNPAAMHSRQRVLRFEHDAMATTFQIYTYNQTPNDAVQAAETAFAEIDLLEKKMSFFIPGSEISQINSLLPGQSIIVSGQTLACLELSMQVYQQSGGAFDPTVGSLLRGRKRWDRDDADPIDPEETAAVGMNLLELDETERIVRRKVDGVKLDMGSVTKGYAADEAARILTDWGMTPCMVVAGQSTMLPIGLPPGEDGWMMRIRDPRNETDILRTVKVRDVAISAASIAAKQHILDPRTFQPVSHTIGAWVAAPTGVLSDALSTAFIVMNAQEVEQYCKDHPQVSAILFTEQNKLLSFGTWNDVTG